MNYDWPGNIRELEGVVRNLLIFAHGKKLTKDLLLRHKNLFGTSSTPTSPKRSGIAPASLSSKSDTAEAKKILESLRRNHLDKNQVATDLGVSLKTVYLQMERYGIPTKRSALIKFLES
jgi:transcriptional regulator with PAS, ATPase and Fis domain